MFCDDLEGHKCLAGEVKPHSYGDLVVILYLRTH